jgi:transcriptional regulator with XRE-family HTH domain
MARDTVTPRHGKNPDLTRYSGDRLGPILLAQGRKRTWLAAQVGVHPSLITHILSGRRTASEELATRIAAVLGIPLFFVFESHEREHSVASEDEEKAAA